ncbi:MAG: VTT domain-containing protein [Pseudomonadota bacterium]|nr:VTT domain-containing protein [Pseudomonadota bacterium]
MVEFWRRMWRFLGAMDAKAWTSLSVSLTLLAFVVLMFLFGQDWLKLDKDGELTTLLMRAANSDLALIGVISVYTLLALTGFPQILLFAATVIAFGPQKGALFAWIATMASATFTFFIGHLLGGRWVRKFSHERVQSTIEFLTRRGIVASGLIRVVPSAPFVVVNAAAGAAHIPLWKYWLGTGVGIVPKILLVAGIGAFWPDQAVLTEGIGVVVEFFQSRKPRDLAILAAIVVAWLAFLYVMRLVYVRLRRREQK